MFEEIKNELYHFHKESDFLTGGCYYFAKLVTEKYGGQIYINRLLEHCAIMYQGKLYDIKGQIKNIEGFHLIKPWEEKMCKKEYHFKGESL